MLKGFRCTCFEDKKRICSSNCRVKKKKLQFSRESSRERLISLCVLEVLVVIDECRTILTDKLLMNNCLEQALKSRS